MNESPTELESASFLRRFIAQAIDTTVIAALMIVPFSLAPAHSTLETLLLCASLSFALIYRVIGDGLFEGAALGKRILGIYVVDAATRRPCSIGQAAIRMGILIIPLTPLIEPVVLACDGQQRWGDRVAHTYVLRRHPKQSPVISTPPRPLNLTGLRETLNKLRSPDRDAYRNRSEGSGPRLQTVALCAVETGFR